MAFNFSLLSASSNTNVRISKYLSDMNTFFDTNISLNYFSDSSFTTVAKSSQNMEQSLRNVNLLF
jgi:hypothetical protein